MHVCVWLRNGWNDKQRGGIKTNPDILHLFTGSDGGLSAEEVKGHGRQEGWDALLVMKMKGNHLSQSFGELRLHELHASIGALHTHKHNKPEPTGPK